MSDSEVLNGVIRVYHQWGPAAKAPAEARLRSKFQSVDDLHLKHCLEAAKQATRAAESVLYSAIDSGVTERDELWRVFLVGLQGSYPWLDYGSKRRLFFNCTYGAWRDGMLPTPQAAPHRSVFALLKDWFK